MKDIFMSNWSIAYELNIESKTESHGQVVLDIVKASSYFDLINRGLRDSVEKITETTLGKKHGLIQIQVDVIEVKELKRMVP